MVVDISKMESYSAPVSSGLYAQLSISLISIGLFLAVWFFIFESGSKKARNYFKEIFGAAASSVFLGFGVLFLFLWVGVWV